MLQKHSVICNNEHLKKRNCVTKFDGLDVLALDPHMFTVFIKETFMTKLGKTISKRTINWFAPNSLINITFLSSFLHDFSMI